MLARLCKFPWAERAHPALRFLNARTTSRRRPLTGSGAAVRHWSGPREDQPLTSAPTNIRRTTVLVADSRPRGRARRRAALEESGLEVCAEVGKRGRRSWRRRAPGARHLPHRCAPGRCRRRRCRHQDPRAGEPGRHRRRVGKRRGSRRTRSGSIRLPRRPGPAPARPCARARARRRGRDSACPRRHPRLRVPPAGCASPSCCGARRARRAAHLPRMGSPRAPRRVIPDGGDRAAVGREPRDRAKPCCFGRPEARRCRPRRRAPGNRTRSGV